MLDTLKQLAIVTPDHLAELEGHGPLPADPAGLLQHLRERGVLTGFQLVHLKSGQANDLLLGQYLLLEPVGTGGMGEVYRARHTLLDRPAAIKVISSSRMASADAVARFHREARAAARLLHPNVVVVFDFGQVGDRHYYAMEFIAGIDLRNLVQQFGPLDPTRACFYARQAALGLQHAHEQGLVHRDIKPGNLMLSPWPLPPSQPGVVKILDFGLARLTGGSSAAPLTGSGAIMGTPDYIAPEQVRNASGVDIRADIYSLGGTLFTLLTGQVPFPAKSLHGKVFGRMTKPAPLVTELRPELPTPLAAVIAKMMAIDPGQRYQTPLEVADTLAIFTGEPVSGSVRLPPLPPRKPTHLATDATTEFRPGIGN